MKKIIFIAVLAISGSAFGQVSKGSLFLGGGFGFSSGSSETSFSDPALTPPPNTKTSSFNFMPSVGYFLTDHIAAGVMVNFGTSKTETGPNALKSSNFGAGVFARYYAGINERFYFWGQADLGFGSGKSETTTAAGTFTTGKSSNFGLGVSPGFSFFPSSRYGFDFSVGRLGISNTTTETTTIPPTPITTTTKTSGFDLNWNMTAITIGVQIFFGGGGGTMAK